MAHHILDLFSGPAWNAYKAFLLSCNWHLQIYAALGCSLLMRAHLARREERYDQAREQAYDGLLYLVLGLLAIGH